MSNPCGICYRLKGIKVNSMETLYYGYPSDSRVDLIYCLCGSNIQSNNKCHQVDKSVARKNIMKTPTKLS